MPVDDVTERVPPRPEQHGRPPASVLAACQLVG
jgi:hypothetical protein